MILQVPCVLSHECSPDRPERPLNRSPKGILRGCGEGFCYWGCGWRPNRQSQISRQIKELEDALGVALFERVNRRLLPTPLGRDLALMTTAFFASLADLTERDLQRGELIRIAAGESVFSGFIVPRFDRMRDALPNHRCAFHQCSTEDALSRVWTGKTDIAVVRDTANVGKLEITELGRAQYRLAVPRQLLPGRQKEGLAKLKGLPIALLSGTGELNRRLEEVFQETGAEVRIVAESDTFATLRDLVQTGSVAAILPEWSAKTLPAESTAIVVLPELKILERTLVIATHSRLASIRPVMAEAVSALREIWRP
ncbi:MAG: LysR family transcriptional regulator [Terrimicrobiaceae bacterium]